jgi:hypothetical protein
MSKLRSLCEEIKLPRFVQVANYVVGFANHDQVGGSFAEQRLVADVN